MLLLDRVLSYDGERVVCETVLGPDSPFDEQGEVPAVCGIEYMAQTIAAGAGLSARDKGDQAGRMGFLLGVPQPEHRRRQLPGRRSADHRSAATWGENQIGSFAARCSGAAQVLVEGALTVYQGPLPRSMIR
jgi:predicted hotdog family 3-hydroxylacyl-ACP dehydratase